MDFIFKPNMNEASNVTFVVTVIDQKALWPI